MKKKLLLLALFWIGVVTLLWAQNNPFTAEWKSDQSGKIMIPIKGTNWKLEIWEGGNKVKEATVASSDESTNIHSVDGLMTNKRHTVKIYPEGVEYIRFGSDQAKEAAKGLERIMDWGDVKWKSMERAFANCVNLTAANVGEPILTEVKSCKEMFAGCEKFNSSLNTWKMETVEDLEKMFDGCKAYNQNMQKWTLAKATKISFGVVEKLSKDNYEKTLIGWAANEKTASNVTFDAKDLVYSSTQAKAAHDKLTTEKHWTISDDKYLLFKFKNERYYCKKDGEVSVEIELAEGLDKTKVEYRAPGEYDEGKGVIKVENKSEAKVKGVKVGKATLTATLKNGNMTLKAECEIVVNSTGTEPTHKLTLSKSGTGEGTLTVRKKGTTENLAMGDHNLPAGTTLLVNVDYDKNKAKLELKIDDANQTSSIDYGDAEIVLKKDTKIEAVLTEIKNWKVEFAAAQNGTMSVHGKDGAQLEAGKENKTPDGTLIIVSFTAETGYALEEFRVNGTKTNVDGDSHSFLLKQDVVLEAFFSKADERSVVLEIAGGATNGSVMVGDKALTAGVNKVAKDSKQKVSVKPNEGYRVKTFTIDGVDKKEEALKGVEVTFDKIVEISLEFEEETEKVTVSWDDPKEDIAELEVRDKDGNELASGDEVIVNTKITIRVIMNDEEYKLVELRAGVVDLLPTKQNESYFCTVGTENVTITHRFEKKELVEIAFENPNDKEGEVTIFYASGTDIIQCTSGAAIETGTKLFIKAEGKGDYKLTELKANGEDIRKDEYWDATQKAYFYILPAGLTNKKVTFDYKFEKGVNPPNPGVEKVDVTLNVTGTLYGEVKVGTQTLASGVNKVNKGETLKVTAVANTGFQLKSFTIDGVDKLAEVKAGGVDVTFSQAVVIAVEFEATGSNPPNPGVEKVDVTLNVTGTLDGEVKVGTQALASGVNKVNKGETLKVTAVANTGFQLKSFTIDGVDKLAEVKAGGVDVTFSQAVVIAVAFEAAGQEADKFTITIVQPQDGAIVVKTADGKVLENGAKVERSSVTLTATPSAQYELEWLKANEEDLTAKVDKTTHTVTYEVTKDVKFMAKFKKHSGGGGKEKEPKAVEDALFADVVVAPNPFTTVLRIVGNEVSGVRYELLNAQGAVVRSGAVDAREVTVDTTELTAGLYLVRLSDGKGATRVYRVVKQ